MHLSFSTRIHWFSLCTRLTFCSPLKCPFSRRWVKNKICFRDNRTLHLAFSFLRVLPIYVASYTLYTPEQLLIGMGSLILDRKLYKVPLSPPWWVSSLCVQAPHLSWVKHTSSCEAHYCLIFYKLPQKYMFSLVYSQIILLFVYILVLLSTRWWKWCYQKLLVLKINKFAAEKLVFFSWEQCTSNRVP